MKKLLLSLAVLALATPAMAAPLTIADWAAAPIVAGDKTFTYVSHTGLLDSNIRVDANDLGLSHSLNLTGLGPEDSNFTLNFTITVNTPPQKIIGTRVSENDVIGNSTAGSTTIASSGATSYTDTLIQSQQGPINPWNYVDTVAFAVSSSGIDAGNRLSNMTFDVVQGQPPVIPEPSTFALAGLAVAGLVIARRRAR